MKHLLLSVAALALVAGSPVMAKSTAPTTAQAKSFVAKAEKDLAEISVYAQKADWVQETYINDDTNFLTAKAGAEATEMATKYAKQAARFDHVEVDAVTRRKLVLLKNGLVLPSPDRPGAAQEMADIQARLSTLYSTGTATI